MLLDAKGRPIRRQTSPTEGAVEAAEARLYGGDRSRALLFGPDGNVVARGPHGGDGSGFAAWLPMPGAALFAAVLLAAVPAAAAPFSDIRPLPNPSTSGNLLTSDGTNWTSAAPGAPGDNTVTPAKLALAVRNGTGGTLAVGTLVYVSSWNAANSRPLVSKADADVAGARAFYVVSTAIANNANGTVSRTYLLEAQDTSGASAVGAAVYLDTTAGGWTLTAPTGATAVVQVVGRVTVKDATVGAVQFDLQSQGVTSEGTNELQAQAVTMPKLARGTDGQVIIGQTGADPAYTTISGDATLAANGAVTLASTAVTPGAYSFASVEVDQKGRVINAANGSAAAPGVLVAMQVFTTGTGATYTASGGATVAVFEIIGGGGGGGGADSDQATTAGVGGGGGSGGYAVKKYTSLSGITYTVGAAGTGGAAGNNAGTAGGDSTVTQSATTVTAKGGSGGAAGTAAATATIRAGGAGGTVSTNGDINGAGDPGGPGVNVLITAGVGGNGAGSVIGGGGAGGSDAAGGAAATYGAGGGGGEAPSTGAADRAGGNGGGGLIVVWEYR